MEQLQKKLQAGRSRVSIATEELEFAQRALAAMEEEEKLLESEVGEREGRFLGAMEVTETAVEGGVASKKKVKKVGKGKALGGKFTGKIFCGRCPDYVER